MKHLIYKYKKLSENKSLEYEFIYHKISLYNVFDFSINILSDTSFFRIYFNLFNLLNIHFDWSRKRDHAGAYRK